MTLEIITSPMQTIFLNGKRQKALQNDINHLFFVSLAFELINF